MRVKCGYSPCLLGKMAKEYCDISRKQNCDVADMETAICPKIAAETSNLTSGFVYNLMNKTSGKCLNVNYGTDANGTNVTQYTKDGTIEQRFKLVYNNLRDSYM